MTAVLETPDLTEQEKAFIRGDGVPRAVKAAPEGAALTAPADVESSAVNQAPPRSRIKGTVRIVSPMVGLATRIPAELQERLMRASFERKLERVEPSTHQDIVSEALSEWLKKRGF